MVTQPGLAAVPLTLHGVSGGRTDAGPPHQERSTWPTQNGRQLPQVCGVPPLKKKIIIMIYFRVLTGPGNLEKVSEFEMKHSVHGKVPGFLNLDKVMGKVLEF